jgi:hypothetical protein
VGDDRSMPAQAETGINLVVMVDGSGLESIQREMLYRANKLPSCASTRDLRDE